MSDEPEDDEDDDEPDPNDSHLDWHQFVREHLRAYPNDGWLIENIDAEYRFYLEERKQKWRFCLREV